LRLRFCFPPYSSSSSFSSQFLVSLTHLRQPILWLCHDQLYLLSCYFSLILFVYVLNLLLHPLFLGPAGYLCISAKCSAGNPFEVSQKIFLPPKLSNISARSLQNMADFWNTSFNYYVLINVKS
jgi:hypothetical protein